MAQRDFAQKHLPDYPLFKLVSLFYEVVPPVLQAGGKVGCAGSVTAAILWVWSSVLLSAWQSVNPTLQGPAAYLQGAPMLYLLLMPGACANVALQNLARLRHSSNAARPVQDLHAPMNSTIGCALLPDLTSLNSVVDPGTAGEEPMAQCGRALRGAAAALRHDRVQLLHRAVWRVARHRRAVPGGYQPSMYNQTAAPAQGGHQHIRERKLLVCRTLQLCRQLCS
jgi:hypothetical protein